MAVARTFFFSGDFLDIISEIIRLGALSVIMKYNASSVTCYMWLLFLRQNYNDGDYVNLWRFTYQIFPSGIISQELKKLNKMEKYLRRFINIYIKIFASTISDRITVCTRLSGHFAVSLRVLQELTLSVALLHPTFRQYSLFIPLYFLKYIPIVRETHDKKFESSRPAMCIKCAW